MGMVIGSLLWFCQIDAHIGNVSDLAFSHPNKQLCIITCGEDKAIRVGILWTFLFDGMMKQWSAIINPCLCRCGMLSLVLNSTLVRVMRHLCILCAHILRKTFRYIFIQGLLL